MIFTLYRNESNSTASVVLWAIYSFAMTLLVHRIVTDCVSGSVDKHFFVWPGNAFWMACLAITVSISVVLGFAYRWGPTIPVMAIAMVFAPYGIEIPFIAASFVIGFALDSIYNVRSAREMRLLQQQNTN